MKQLIVIFILFPFCCFSQKEKFDITTYTPVKGWKKTQQKDFVQFSKEDKSKGAYCVITLYKAVDAAGDAKTNFNTAWDALVKETLGVTGAPTMQDAIQEKEWEVQSGHGNFEKDGNAGVALLVSSSGFSKMVNILILTNSDTYESSITNFLESVDFKKPAISNTKTTTVTKPQTPSTVVKGSYSFNTTNFDDGWTATEQADWVEVSKGNIKVLLHYPKEGTIFPADPAPMTNAAWNILVAPRYSNLKKYATNYISSYVRGYLATGYATLNATGASVFIFFFHKNNGWMECIAPDKNSFIQQFKFDPESINYNSDDGIANSFDAMAARNKFAVSASDLNGTGIWTNSFASNTFYTNIYTGNSAGMSTYTSGEDYTFLPGQKFKWSLVAANSYSGKTDFAQGKGEGNWKMNNNWEIWFSNKEGKPKRYNAFFSCIKGARLLHLLDADYPGSGIYTTFGKKM